MFVTDILSLPSASLVLYMDMGVFKLKANKWLVAKESSKATAKKVLIIFENKEFFLSMMVSFKLYKHFNRFNLNIQVASKIKNPAVFF